MEFIIEDNVLVKWTGNEDSRLIPEEVTKINRFISIPGNFGSITIPKSVTEIGEHALKEFKEIEIFDTIDPDAGDCYEHIDMVNGYATASPGWMNNSRYDALSLHKWFNHVITVRSAETGEIKYKVVMECDGRQRQYYSLLATAWGRNATFAFKELDRFFPKIKGKNIKAHVAVSRLKYRTELTDEAEQMYIKFVTKNSDFIIRECIDLNESEGIQLCKLLNAIRQKELDDLIAYANEQNNTSATMELMDYKNKCFPMSVKTPESDLKLPRAAKCKEKDEPVLGTKEYVNRMFTLKNELHFGPYVITGKCITRYKGTDKEVDFPQKYGDEKIIGITACGAEIPDNYKTLKKVILPKGYKYIGARAFKGCAELEEIILPSTLIGIEKEAFAECVKLKKIALPKSVEVIKEEAFMGCTSLEQIVLPKKVKTAGKWMLRDCTGLKNIYIMNKNFDASDSAMLRGCTGFTIHAPEKALISKWAKKGSFAVLTEEEVEEIGKK